MEPLKHECGIALIRLRKPLEYYAEHYGTTLYGLNKLYLLMEKQRAGWCRAGCRQNASPPRRRVHLPRESSRK